MTSGQNYSPKILFIETLQTFNQKEDIDALNTFLLKDK